MNRPPFLPFLPRRLVGLLAALMLLVCWADVSCAAASGADWLVYFGTYTGKKSRGIYVSRFNAATGALGAPELAAEAASPSFLAVHPKGRFLYSVNEVDKTRDKPAGGVSAFGIDAATGKLTPLNQQSSGGPGPCHLIVDKAGRNVLVANYGGGSVAVLPLDKDGSLREASAFVQHKGSSVNQSRQEAPHAHGIYLDSANRFAFVPDLGLDRLVAYRFDPSHGTLTPNEPAFASVAPGSGPRHFAFTPNGRFAYVINEMLCTVTAFSFDPKRGGLSELQTISTLPEGESIKPGYSTAELFVHPSGKFLYGSNRGHDSIVSYAIDGKSGKLSRVSHTPTQGKIPRSFGIDPSGRWLLAANQNSDSVVVFKVDTGTGQLTATGGIVEVGAPVSVAFVRAR